MAVKRFYFFGSYSSFRPFIMEVESGGSGVFTIPTTGSGYNYDVKTLPDNQIFTGQTGNLTITFPSPNTRYDVEFSGLFPRIYFNTGSERLKIKDIKQWGDVAWGANQTNAFYGCGEMTCSAFDLPDMEHITSAVNMFRITNNFNPVTFDLKFANLVNGERMFQGCTVFNPSDFAPTFESLINGLGMFWGALNFAQEIYAPNSVNLEVDNSMFRDTKIKKITLNNSSLISTAAFTFICPELTDLILTNRKIDLWIDQAPLLLSTKIDDLANSVADLTSLTSATVTMTQTQFNSCDTTIWVNKNWTIAIA